MIIGLVGKPSAGKSTFFKACTLAEVEIANYPFTTIEPNQGVGFVRVDCVDKEFDKQCNPRFGYCINGTRFVPVELIDVAGLVPGAHEGKGRGNQFLDDLRQADVLIHVVDISGSVNENGEPVEVLSYDPAKDIKFLEIEIDMWYLAILRKGWLKFARQVQQEKQDIKKALAKQLSGLKVDEDMVQESMKELDLGEDPTTWSEEDLKSLATSFRRKTKPIIIAANKIDIPGAEKNFERIKNEFKDYIVVGCSAEAELALKEAAKKNLIDYVPGENSFEIKGEIDEKQENALKFIKESVLDKFGSSGVQEILDKAVFDLLGYIAIFPGGGNLTDKDGNVLPDCFLLKGGSTALEFAYSLHTDIGDKFVKAVDYKTKKVIGKDHKLKHRDVIEIKTS